MKYLILIALIFINRQIIFSQSAIEIKDIRINNIKPKEDDVDEGDEDGPGLEIIFAIKNTSESDVLIIYPKTSKLYLCFNYSNKKFKKQIFIYDFDNEYITIGPKSELKLLIDSSILLGTSIIKDGINDYTKQIIEILPTLRIKYKDISNEIYSTQILNVTVINYSS